MKISNNILETIGNTPMVRLNNITSSIESQVLVKLEFFNPGSSVKDRMAVKMVEDAEKQGLLNPGGTIVEGTSGNTGMGLALAAIVKGYKLICVSTDKQSKEKFVCECGGHYTRYHKNRHLKTTKHIQFINP